MSRIDRLDMFFQLDEGTCSVSPSWPISAWRNDLIATSLYKATRVRTRLNSRVSSLFGIFEQRYIRKFSGTGWWGISKECGFSMPHWIGSSCSYRDSSSSPMRLKIQGFTLLVCVIVELHLRLKSEALEQWLLESTKLHVWQFMDAFEMHRIVWLCFK